MVDYKTGRVLEDDENIHDGNAAAIADKIFAPDVKDRPKIALQFFIYDMLVQSRPEVAGRSLVNSVYSTARLFKNPPVSVPCNKTFCEAVSEHLKTVLDQMYDLEVPFRRTDDRTVCGYCDFQDDMRPLVSGMGYKSNRYAQDNESFGRLGKNLQPCQKIYFHIAQKQ